MLSILFTVSALSVLKIIISIEKKIVRYIQDLNNRKTLFLKKSSEFKM